MSTMTTSLASSREGLTDIGPSADNNERVDDCGDGCPNWKERIDVSIAKSRKIRGSNYVQISTIDHEKMEPRCRTVVFRGFLKDVPIDAVKQVLGGVAGDSDNGYGCVMKMITDARSNKVRELEAFHDLKERAMNGNNAEMVWWFPKSSEQYRISGRLQFIGSNGPLHSHMDTSGSESLNRYFISERKQIWGNLSDPAREQFYWENPGIPFTSTWEQGQGIPQGGRDDDGKVLPPPDTFLLMLLYPTKIDYLRLGDNYRQVDEWDWGDADESSGYHWISKRVNP